MQSTLHGWRVDVYLAVGPRNSLPIPLVYPVPDPQGAANADADIRIPEGKRSGKQIERKAQQCAARDLPDLGRCDARLEQAMLM